MSPIQSVAGTRLLFSADDRTGALEIGGLVGRVDTPLAVGPFARDSRCCVVDIATRHLTPDQAQARMRSLLSQPADVRAHKMDAGLRGNWAYEIQVLLEAGYKVAVVCAFPDAGRRCLDGVVYIHDKPVTESVFANDPLNLPTSSRPAEVLAAAGVEGDVVVWDANDNAQMYAAVKGAMDEERVVVGASGALGAVAELVFKHSSPTPIDLNLPVLVACGSLNPLSRRQIDAIDTPSDGSVEVLATDMIEQIESAESAQRTATQLATEIRARWSQLATLIVVGGDTVGALVGDDTLEVIGTAAPGIPVSRYRGLHLVTKGGGIGEVGTLAAILRKCG